MVYKEYNKGKQTKGNYKGCIYQEDVKGRFTSPEYPFTGKGKGPVSCQQVGQQSPAHAQYSV